MVARGRDDLHDLVDALPESELLTARRFLRYLFETSADPDDAIEEAPADDEPLAEDDATAVGAERGGSRRAAVISLDAFRRRPRS